MITLHEASQGEVITLSISIDTGACIHRATLSGRFRYYLIDGLCWWAYGRLLDHVVANTMTADGEELIHLYTRTPWHEAHEDRAKRIVAHFQDRMPVLMPLVSDRPDLAEALDNAMALLRVLMERLDDPEQKALRGVERWYVNEAA